MPEILPNPMDSEQRVNVSTPSTTVCPSNTVIDETPSQEPCEQLKKRHLDFNSCSAQKVFVGSSKTKNGKITSQSEPGTPILNASRATKERPAQDLSSMLDNSKITLDKIQLARLLEMTISQTKAQQQKEQREKKEAEMSVKREAKKKKEEEKLRLQSEKIKNQKLQSQNFLKFFTKPSTNKANAKRQDAGWIPSFPVQPGMTLAKPPPPLQDTSKFDGILKVQEDNFISSYVDKCKTKKPEGKTTACSSVKQQSDDDVIIVDEKDDKMKDKQLVKYKLLQFHENYRPAYYGTWQKVSTIVQPRNPFKKDETLLDYCVDSDDEWEEEEPGESLSDCHSADEGEDMDDEDEEDGFFVPHGYLSDGEGELDDNETAELPKESKEEKMKMKEKAWEIEFARKCQPLKPVCIGCCWASNGTEAKRNALLQYQAVLFASLPIAINFNQEKKASPNINTTPKPDKPTTLLTPKSSSPQTTICYKFKPVPEEAMPCLIKLLQGSSVGLERAIKNLRVYWGRKVMADKSNGETIQAGNYSESDYEQASGISKRQLEKKIHEIAKKVDRVWQIDKSILERYEIPSPSSAKLELHTNVSPQNKHCSVIKQYLLKENYIPSKSNTTTTDKQDECPSPARKRLKLTETQSPSLVIT